MNVQKAKQRMETSVPSHLDIELGEGEMILLEVSVREIGRCWSKGMILHL